MKYVAIVFILISLTSCGTSKKNVKAPAIGKMVTTNSGLQYIILNEGKGVGARKGDHLLIYETISYRNGKVLFSNMDTDTPIEIIVGTNQATKGEDEGLTGMKEGEIRKMIIPPNLSKRKEYPPNLSPDSTIVIKVKLFKISK
ncbi:MAG: FKBP-type peptidyl-prolyl cis-trans isomerase [Flavobacteriaceae bacterium]